MSELYIEKRESGDYAIHRPGSERASSLRRTREEAINWCRDHMPGATIFVERKKQTLVGGRDRWKRVN